MENKEIKMDPLLIKSFGITERSRPDILLRDFLEANIVGLQSNVFYENFYHDDEYIQTRAREFLDQLDDGTCPFHLLHGYSKNGKTSFLHYIRYMNNNDKYNERQYRYIIKSYDFEKGNVADYLEKLKEIYELRFLISTVENIRNTKSRSRKKIISDMNDFLIFYSTFLRELNPGSNEDDANSNIISYFRNFCKDIFSGWEEVIDLTENGEKGTVIEINNIIKQKIINTIDKDNCGNCFSFLILYDLFTYKWQLLQEKPASAKLIFVLDNIDDYLVNNDILFFQHPQIQLSTFINNLISYPIINLAFSACLRASVTGPTHNLQNVNLKEQIQIVYVLRTANFFVFSTVFQKMRENIAGSAERNLPECLLDRKYIRFKTIQDTAAILRRRFDLYDYYADLFKLTKPRGYHFLKSLSNNYFDLKVDDPRPKANNIFCMFNGDKREMIRSIITHWSNIKNDFFDYEDLVAKAASTDFYSSKYLLNGVYIYFFLKLHAYDMKNHEGFLENIFHYKRGYAKARKSLERFILNYIINLSEAKGHPKAIREIPERGIGLYQLLSQIDKFCDRINRQADEDIFTRDVVESFFKNLYSKKIDYYSHFFTIYKSQILSPDIQKTVISNYYNLDDEIRQIYANEYDVRLDPVRIFNNNNALYTSLYLMNHFELFSFCESHDENPALIIRKPLLFSLGKISESGSGIENFEFYQVINQTFAAVKKSVDGMVDFYIKYLANDITPNQFINSDLFSVKTNGQGDFQFRLIISRHITYLESFRRGIIEDKLASFNTAEKIEINIFIANSILNYINLFQENYVHKILALFNETNDCESLKKTMRAILICEKNARQIIDSHGNDFNTMIISLE